MIIFGKRRNPNTEKQAGIANLARSFARSFAKPVKSFAKGWKNHAGVVKDYKNAIAQGPIPIDPVNNPFPVPHNLAKNGTPADIQAFQQGQFPRSAYSVDPNYSRKGQELSYATVRDINDAIGKAYPIGAPVQKNPHIRRQQPMGVEFNGKPESEGAAAWADEFDGLIENSYGEAAGKPFGIFTQLHEPIHAAQSKLEKDIVLPTNGGHYFYTGKNARNTLAYEDAADNGAYRGAKQMVTDGTMDKNTFNQLSRPIFGLPNPNRPPVQNNSIVYSAPANREFFGELFSKPNKAIQWLGGKAHELASHTNQFGHPREVSRFDQLRHLRNTPGNMINSGRVERAIGLKKLADNKGNVGVVKQLGDSEAAEHLKNYYSTFPYYVVPAAAGYGAYKAWEPMLPKIPLEQLMEKELEFEDFLRQRFNSDNLKKSALRRIPFVKNYYQTSGGRKIR